MRLLSTLLLWSSKNTAAIPLTPAGPIALAVATVQMTSCSGLKANERCRNALAGYVFKRVDLDQGSQQEGAGCVDLKRLTPTVEIFAVQGKQITKFFE